MSDQRQRGTESVSRRPRPQCESGKRRYPNRASAESALTGLAKKAALGNGNRHEGRIYRCPRCNGWHTTSMPRSEQ